MANDLQNLLNNILEDKETNLLPENFKKGVSVLGVDGSFNGVDISDTTAQAGDILYPKTAYVADGSPVTGKIIGEYDTVVAEIAEEVSINIPEMVRDINTQYNLIIAGDFTEEDMNLHMYKYNLNTFEAEEIDKCDLGFTFGSNYSYKFYLFKTMDADSQTLDIFCYSTKDGIKLIRFDMVNSKFLLDTLTPFSKSFTNIVPNPIYSGIFALTDGYSYTTGSSMNYKYGSLVGVYYYNGTSVTSKYSTTVIAGTGSGEFEARNGPKYICWGSDGRSLLHEFRSTSKSTVYQMLYKSSSDMFDSFSTTTVRTGSSSIPRCTIYKNNYVLSGSKLYNGSTLVKDFEELQPYNSYLSGSTSTSCMWIVSDTIFIKSKTNLTSFTINSDLEIAKLQDLSGTFTVDYPASNTEMSKFILNTDNTGYRLASQDFNTYKNVKIYGAILYNTSDATATAGNILENKSVYAKDGHLAGTMKDNGELNYIPTDNEQTIPKGYTSGGKIEAVDITTLRDYQICLEKCNNILGGDI